MFPGVARWFAFCRVGKEQPAYGDKGRDGKVPSRAARKRAADGGNEHAGEDACQQPGEPLEVPGGRHSRRAGAQADCGTALALRSHQLESGAAITAGPGIVGLLDFSPQKETEDRSNCNDRSQDADLVPTGAYDGTDDVGGDEDLETEE